MDADNLVKEETLALLKKAIEANASDIFLIPALPFSYKTSGVITHADENKLMPLKLYEIIKCIYAMANNRSMERLEKEGDDDFSFAVSGLSRFRTNVFRQRGSFAAVIRIVNFDLPNYKEIGIPERVMDIASLKKGFVLVTGPAGSGKSTTLACIIDRINHTRRDHVVTLEDPIEYLHKHDKSIVTQREIITDTENYETALKSVLRQAPDVILVGEMRDFETIRTAITAAETGHLVISTLHTVGAANTVDRIIDTFPPNQQQQIRAQLSMVLSAVISQQLVPSKDDSVVPVFETMFMNLAIRNLIREGKNHQIDGVLAASAKDGMGTMDMALLDLYKEGKIDKDTCLDYSVSREWMEKRIG